jgi:hypothetical protein
MVQCYQGYWSSLSWKIARHDCVWRASAIAIIASCPVGDGTWVRESMSRPKQALGPGRRLTLFRSLCSRRTWKTIRPPLRGPTRRYLRRRQRQSFLGAQSRRACCSNGKNGQLSKRNDPKGFAKLYERSSRWEMKARGAS